MVFALIATRRSMGGDEVLKNIACFLGGGCVAFDIVTIRQIIPNVQYPVTALILNLAVVTVIVISSRKGA